MNHSARFVIIGAGPTGIGAAYHLKQKGIEDFLILEKEAYAGGLASSFVDDQGFTWDIGGHVQFSHYDYFDRAMVDALGENGWLVHERESWAWMQNRFVPYPVQNNLRYLPPEETLKCVKGLLRRPLTSDGKLARLPTNFKDWMLSLFGEDFSKLFMIPYNSKVWAYGPEKMQYGWVGERVSVPSLERILENIIYQKDDLSWGPNHTFQFPKKGGTGAIWKSLAGKLGPSKIRYWSEVQSINTLKKQIRLKTGEIIQYENCLSTLPLTQLVRMIEPQAPAEMLELSSQFLFSSSNIVGLGLKGQPPENLSKKCWMYFPESNCPFYRVTVFSNYSPQNVPDSDQYWSLMTETSESSDRVLPKNLIEDTIQGALNTGLIENRSQVVSTWKFRANHGYPTPFLDRNQLLDRIIPWMDQTGVHTRGRFGGWKYEVSNQDHSFMQGVEWAEKCLNPSAKEQTYFDPEYVNSPGKRAHP